MPETQLNVCMLAHTPDPVVTTALAGRLCYSDSDILSLQEGVRGRAPQFVEKLASLGHLSPFEHVSFTFGVEGVSRALLAQITRHRIASFSVQSQRYVKQNGGNHVVPPSIAALGPEAVSRFEAQMDTIWSFYGEWLEAGIPAEDARFVLPNAAETRMVFTMNARELMHFFSLRCCGRAQWEIRRLAWCMLGLVRREAPELFGKCGPHCIGGACSEGKMTCGRQAEMRACSEALTALAESGADDAAILAWTLANIHNEN
ncbi:FAD-dependent thymidylate synthase [bacterium]|nr:FAD-dependent thymidylate synthase [bacterium]